MNYKQSDFTTANIKILENFKVCVNERSLDKITKALYQFLHIHGPFIAHYNFNGFKATYEDHAFLKFVEHYQSHIYHIRIETEEYRQVNAMNMLMQHYVQACMEQIIFEFNNRIESSKMALLKALADELGYNVTVKDNTGAVDPNTKIEANGQVSLF